MRLLTCIAVSFLLLCLAFQLSFSKETEHHSDNSSAGILCLNVEYCEEAAKCCHLGVDEYGWIAAAVGWSLWFLTLILFCIDKLMKLQPDEPKYLGA